MFDTFKFICIVIILSIISPIIVLYSGLELVINGYKINDIDLEILRRYNIVGDKDDRD